MLPSPRILPLRKPLARQWITIFALFVVHNLEELVLDLPTWGRSHLAFLEQARVSPDRFGTLVGVLCIALFATAYWARENAATTRRLMMVFLAVMLGVFTWHVGISLYTRSMQPGVVTAVVFFPVYVIWLARSRRTSNSSGS